MAINDAEDKLSKGESLEFDPNTERESRTIKAIWIVQSVAEKKRIRVRHAIIQGALNLKYSNCAEEFELLNCTFENTVDFAFSTFDKNLDVSGSVFKVGATFESAVLRRNGNLSGCKFHNGDLNFVDLVVEGRFYCNNASFESQLSTNFEFARFRRSAFFNGSSFSGAASFAESIFESNIDFGGISFSKTADFSGGTVHGRLSFSSFAPAGESGAVFRSSASFDRLTVRGLCYCGRVTFMGPVAFKGASLSGEAIFHRVRADKGIDFSGSHFGPTEFYGFDCSGKADFTGCIFEGDVSFSRDPDRTMEPAKFAGDADFTGADIHGQLSFRSVAVTGETSFNGAVIKSDAFFDSEREQDSCSFEGPVDFIGLQVGGGARFDHARFKNGANFKKTRFSEGVAFCHSIFEASMDFSNADVLGNSDFTDAQFNGARFNGTRFRGEVYFEGTRFQSKTFFEDCQFDALTSFAGGQTSTSTTQFHEVTFAYSRFAGGATFERSIFNGPTCFVNASFRAVSFEVDNQQFYSTVNLAGCQYDRITVNWASLLFTSEVGGNPKRWSKIPMLVRFWIFGPRTRLEPYDREAIIRLEKSFRQTGEDRAARNIFLKRRLLEQGQKLDKREYLSWVADLLYRGFAKFGVSSIRLCLWGIALVLAGTCVFSRPDTVVPQDLRSDQSASPIHLSTWEAFGVSVHQFLPVDVSMGSTWKPSPRSVTVWVRDQRSVNLRPSYFATVFLRIPGWILVPLAVASVAGLLKRTS